MFRVLFLFLALLPAFVQADPATDLREMSLYRGFADEPFIFDMQISTFRGDKQSGPTQQSSVLFRTFSAVLVDFTAPAAYTGRRILFSGQQMWLSLPNTSRMVRISAADRLMGEASNGDILNIDLDLYTLEALAIEVVDGVDYKRISAVANQPGMLYPRVDFLLDQQTNRPFRSYHFASSGKVLKVAQYVKFDVDGGRERLRQLILLDPANSANYTVMEFSNYRAEDLPAAIFAPSAIRNPMNYGGKQR
jgi:hypothetical protein